MSEKTGSTLVGGTTFNCYNPIKTTGSKIVGTFDLNASASSFEFEMQYANGDKTSYRLDYWINNGAAETMTITPENAFFTKYGTYTSVKCNLTAPSQGGDGSTNCRIRIF